MSRFGKREVSRSSTVARSAWLAPFPKKTRETLPEKPIFETSGARLYYESMSGCACHAPEVISAATPSDLKSIAVAGARDMSAVASTCR
jgi:hypothetical protein